MLYLGDSLEILPTLKTNSVNMVFADPPYFLSNGGLSIKSGKVVSVDKGEWDKKDNYDDTSNFTITWLKECFRILKIDGTIWVSGTHHNIFEVEKNLKECGFKIINIIIWHKEDPPPLIYKNKFRFSYEFIIWAKKGKKYFFNYDLMHSLKKTEMEDVWRMSAVKMNEKKFGYHPTQKPEQLLRRIILCCTKEGDVVLDPFLGSGTTTFVAKQLNRQYVGIEKEKSYFEISKARTNSV